MIVNSHLGNLAMAGVLTIGTIETRATTETTEEETTRATDAAEAEDTTNAIIATTEIDAPHHASRKDALDSRLLKIRTIVIRTDI